MVDSLLPGPSLDPDGRDIDESRGGSWLETTHLVHGRKLGVVKTLVGVSSFDNDVTLVKLQSDDTVDCLLGSGDSGHDEFTFWGEEESIVEDLGELNSDELISDRTDVSVQSHSLEIHVGGSEDGSGWGFVTSTRLDTDESVLDNIDTSNSVLSGESVQGQKDLNRVGHTLAIGRGGDLDWETLEEFNVDLLGLFGCVLRRSGELPHVVRWGLVGVLEDTSLVRNVEEVLVGRPWLGSGLDNLDTVLGSVL